MIDIKDLSIEDVELLKKQFLEKRIIQIKDILKPIEEYFWKFDFNADTQAYELYLGVPKEWLHDMTLEGYAIQLFKETDNGKIIKLGTTSDSYIGDIDELILFASDLIQRNHAILSKIKEKESELKLMKEKMVEIQLGLDREIEKLKKIQNGEELETDDAAEESAVEEKPAEVAETNLVTASVYTPPVTMSQEEIDKFVELVKNGK